MIDIDTVSIVLASAGILVALVYYASVLRHQTKLRQTDLIMRLQDTYENRRLLQSIETLHSMKFKDIDEYRKKYLPSDREETREEEGLYSPEVRALARLVRFFDTVGILLHRKLIDIEMVDELFGSTIKSAWEKFIPIAEWRRKDWHLPTAFQYWEYLYDELKKREQPK